MERLNRILNKAISLYGVGYTEGSYTDLYVQRLIKIYSRPQNNSLEEEHGDKVITGELTLSEPVILSDADMNQKVIVQLR